MPEVFLFAAVASLCWWAALRVAWRWVGGGWPRVAAAAALLGAGATLIPPICGLLGLGASALVLAVASVAVALPAGLRAGPPGRGALEEATPGDRVMAGGLAAFAVAQFLRPEVRSDGFHLTEVVRWLHEGRPGALELVIQEFPADAYPVTNELILTWAIGLARSFSPTILLTVAFVGLLAGSVRAGLASRDVPTAGGWLAAAAVTLAVVTTGAPEAVATDLPSMAWLASSAALAAAAHPGAAVLALGLAVGTKTTTAIAGGALLLVLGWPARHRLRRWDLAAVGAAAAVSLAWPLRNLVEHGSPLWPFSEVGPGDPLPGVLPKLQTSLLDAPGPSLDLYWRLATGDLATSVLLLGGAIAAAVLTRRRDVVVVAALAVAVMLMWAASPLTGQPPPELGSAAQSSLRYALPGTILAAIATALATACGGAVGRGAMVVLALCCAGCLYLLPPRAFVSTEAFAVTAVAALAAGFAASRAAVPSPRVAAAVTAVAVVAGSLVAAPRYMRPKAGEGAEIAGVLAWLDEHSDERRPVVTTWRPDGRLSGERLRRQIELLPTRSSCAVVRERARRAFLLVLREPSYGPGSLSAPGELCLPGVSPAYRDGSWALYAPLSAAAAGRRSATP